MKKKLHFLMLAFGIPALLSLNAQTVQWAGKYGGDGEDVVVDIHVDRNGNIYSTGYFTGNCDFDITDGTFNIPHSEDYEIFVSKLNSAGEFVWAKRFGGLSGDNGTAITTDLLGNVYVTGVYQETADFDPGDGQALLTSSGGLDIFALKLDANGNLLWAKSFGGEDYEQTSGIGVDADGNVYLSGYFYFKTDFDPGIEVFEMSPFGSGDGFIVKLDSSGDFLWAKQFGGVQFDLATGLALTNDGHAYISGNFTGIADFDPDPQTEAILTATNNYDGIYLLHLDQNGDYVNATKVCESDFHTYGMRVAIDSSGAAYVAGYLGGNTTFELEATGPVTLSSMDFFNGYIAKINASGNPAWVNFTNSAEGSLIYDLGVDSQNNVFGYGFYTGTVDLGTLSLTQESVENAQENFLIRLDESGNTITGYTFGGANFVDGCSMAMDDDDNLILSAAFESAVDINPLAGASQSVSSLGFRDNYIIKMDAGTLTVPDVQTPRFVVYPNPVADVVYISSEEMIGSDYFLHDMLGKRILAGRIDDSRAISLSKIESGVYFLTVGNTNTTRRLIKE